MKHDETLRFDVTRGLAAIIVMLAHLAQCFIWRFYNATSWAEMTSGSAARLAVLVFFLLSGRLITASIVSNIRRNGFFDAKDYLLSRIARLYPPLLFAIALAAAVVAIVHVFGLPGADGSPLGTVRPSGISFTPDEVAQSLLLYNGMTTANGPLWTLYIEVKLYIAAGGLAMLAFGRTPTARVIGVIVLAFAVWTGLDHFRFWFFALIWLLGAITNWPFARKPGAVLLTTAIVTLTCFNAPAYDNYLDNPYGTTAQAIVCSIVAYFLIATDWAEISFRNWAARTSKFSYTLYVTHFPILALGLSLSLAINDASFAVAIAAAVVSAVVAMVVAARAARSLENTAAVKTELKRWLAAKPGGGNRKALDRS